MKGRGKEKINKGLRGGGELKFFKRGASLSVGFYFEIDRAFFTYLAISK